MGKTEEIKLGKAFTLQQFLSGITSDTQRIKVFYYQAPDYVAHKSMACQTE